MSKLKIVHIIVGLNVGGAETMLYKLLKYSDRSKFNFEVISLTDKGVFGPKIEKLGIPIHTLGIRKVSFNISAFKKATSLVKNADIIQTWMYHSDLFGYIIKNRSKKQKLIWGIRHSNLEKNDNKKLTLLIARINALLSSKVDLIISCSEHATYTHSEFGYDSSKIITIPNGFELETFYKDPNAKKSLELELQLPKNKPILVHIGRWNVQKDYPNLIKAIRLVHNKRPDINFLLCGTGIEENNKELLNLIKENNIQRNIYLLGRRNDIPKILSAADGLISSSLGEGFSNVIGEAMACETPCIVTDVGDSAYIVDRYGMVVPPKNSQKLAEAVLKFFEKKEEERIEMGNLARERVINEFDIKKIVSKYQEQYFV